VWPSFGINRPAARAAFLQPYKVASEIPSALATSGMEWLCGGSIFFNTDS